MGLSALGTVECWARCFFIPVNLLSIVGNVVIAVLGLQFLIELDSTCARYIHYTTALIVVCFLVSALNCFLLLLNMTKLLGRAKCEYANRLIIAVSLVLSLVFFAWTAAMRWGPADECFDLLPGAYLVYLKAVFALVTCVLGLLLVLFAFLCYVHYQQNYVHS